MVTADNCPHKTSFVKQPGPSGPTKLRLSSHGGIGGKFSFVACGHLFSHVPHIFKLVATVCAQGIQLNTK